MPLAEAEPEITLDVLSEDDLARDPHPHLPVRLDIVFTDETGSGLERFVLRTTGRQVDGLFDKWRAVRLGIANRERRRALAELEAQEQKGALLKEANSRLPPTTDPTAHLQLLERLRRALEHMAGPIPEGPPLGEIEP